MLRAAGGDPSVMGILEMLEEAFGDFYGRNLSIYKEDEYFNGEWVHRNVFSPDMVRTDGSELRITVDVRFAYGTEPEEIVACLQELAASRGGRVENVSVMPAVFVSKDRPFLKVFSEAYDRHWGIPYSGSIAMGGSYAKTMPDIVSWGPIFPGEEDSCHEPNESMSIESIEKCFLIYTEAIQKILFSDRSFK
ncbi:MAG: M20/M25/M40 family metallo-hydrolase [Clostridiales bacterium]|nr:M20/M25/M40 family metallo-hydrolase [Clostridiales bacterium]MCI7392248.1 M20/M25/M40 family metallo-hydrolase [Clostridiales bacterium]MDD6764815.1 M20/M25/M40 family metallo-hydrolase [Bacillota bacterium]MDD6979869.1 M20/M25/M40 family metallo-hydrolase [Bacillota bacterium]MDD7130746.1 M20/M25/M40 family metallo-hydrolase [Bacillota bacterium]